MPRDGYRKFDLDLIRSLCDGQRTSHEIAAQVGCSAKYVQKQMAKHDLRRLPQGPRHGAMNRQWQGGRTIDLDGYALVRSPLGHPSARVNPGKNFGLILEHRLVMETVLCRYLLPEEVVDHIDGLHLHNDPSNLRLFATNAGHLAATISGQKPDWSANGLTAMQVTPSQRRFRQRVDIYGLRKKRGDVRLRQILLAWLSLDADSPHLSGTHRLLEQTQIDWRSRSSLEQAWAELSARLEADLAPSE